MKKKEKSTTSKDMIKMIHKLNEVSKRMEKGRISILFDMMRCGIKYQASSKDYYNFQMYLMTKPERQTVITKGLNHDYFVKYNNPKYIHFFHNKIEFNKRFNNYLNRKWLALNGKNKIEFAEFCKEQERIIAKPVLAQNGKKIEIIDTTERKLKDIYEELIENHQTLIEEVVEQCYSLKKLHPTSINTLRVITLLGKVVACYLRIGNNKNEIDHFNSGGLVAPVDIETGTINYPAIDIEENTYEVHPLTQKEILGIQIPRFQEVIELCEKASIEIPEVGYVGWDVCIGPKTTFLIDGNEFPEHDFYGLPVHRKGNVGLLKEFKKAEERTVEE